jgi:hypothetical protein
MHPTSIGGDMKHQLCSVALAIGVLAGCGGSHNEAEGPAEHAGRKADEATEDAKDQATVAKDKAQEKADEAKKKADEAEHDNGD